MPTETVTRRRRRGVGRPRVIETPTTLPPRDQILDAAAQLFVTRSFGGTSTREIADRVGIRQASLYYHFAGKDEIVSVLLARTVRPTLDQLDKINEIADRSGQAAALYALIMVDTQTLADAPHNTGLLAYLPDVRVLEAFGPHEAALDDLAATYEQLSREIAGSRDLPRRMAITQAEGVIRRRTEGDELDARARHAIAAAVLRSCGVDEDTITIASAVSWAELLDE